MTAVHKMGQAQNFVRLCVIASSPESEKTGTHKIFCWFFSDFISWKNRIPVFPGMKEKWKIRFSAGSSWLTGRNFRYKMKGKFPLAGDFHSHWGSRCVLAGMRLPFFFACISPWFWRSRKRSPHFLFRFSGKWEVKTESCPCPSICWTDLKKIPPFLFCFSLPKTIAENSAGKTG